MLANLRAMVDVRAYTAYPLSSASPRVRIAGYRPSLSRLGISLHLESTLTDAEHAVIASLAPRRTKAVAVARGVRRAVALQPTAVGLFLVHRLLSMTAIPRVDPPCSVDAYDFDDALFTSSLGRGSRSRGLLKPGRARGRRRMSTSPAWKHARSWPALTRPAGSA